MTAKRHPKSLLPVVGKRPGSGVYVHAEAIEGARSNLSSDETKLYFTGKSHIKRQFPRWEYDFVHITKGRVRFIVMSDLWDAHPVAVGVKVFDAKTKTIKDGILSGQIYHRLETMVDPCHPSFRFHCAVTKFEEAAGILSPDAPLCSIGRPAKWASWIETKMPESAYDAVIAALREAFLCAR